MHTILKMAMNNTYTNYYNFNFYYFRRRQERNSGKPRRCRTVHI